MGGQPMAYSALGERVRLTSGGEPLLFSEPGFEYLVGGNWANEHFFVAGTRVASSARTWAAPSAALAPLLSRQRDSLPYESPWRCWPI